MLYIFDEVETERDIYTYYREQSEKISQVENTYKLESKRRMQ